MKKTALLSVYNKQGIVEFATQLQELGWDILASGGTAKALVDAGIKVTDTATLVGEAILGHRVVTLSREIHAALLSTDSQSDQQELAKLNIPRIDLVCVDLYPLIEEIKREGSTKESVIEKTDIGGPTMLRSAAKGRRIVVCDPSDRQKTIDWLKQGEPDRESFISSLVAKAEFVIADYCLASARYHSNENYEGLMGELLQACNYGENAWQTPAGLFSKHGDDSLALDKFKVVTGTAPSYNNLCDLDRLLQTSTHIAAAFDVNYGKAPYIAVGAKHGNSCGAAVSEDKAEVIKKMLEGDLRAIFGGLVIVNFPVDDTLAEVLLTHKMPEGQRRLLDGIIAPGVTDGALEMLKRKGDKCRIFVNPALETINKSSLDSSPRIRYVRGGFLKQPNYTYVLDFKDSALEKTSDLDKQMEKDLLLAWAVGSTSNSNTVTLVRNSQLIGNGVGQQDRVGCCQLAIARAKGAGHEVKDAAAYSDSFFPFTDGPATLIDSGIKAIFATSGSVKDGEVKKYCQDKGTALYLIPDKQARGFFGH